MYFKTGLFQDALGWTIRMLSELESDSVALERLREYEELKGEGEW